MTGYRQGLDWLIGCVVLWMSVAPAWAGALSHVPLARHGVSASQASIPVSFEVSRAVTGIMESTRARVVTALARGDVSAAIVAYEADTGRTAPQWLTALQAAYNTANQVAGRCQDVARSIHAAYHRLGQQPQYIAFKARSEADYMTFELLDGKGAPVTRTGYHVAVKLGDTVRDAYTGPLGMKLSEYLSRLHAIEGVDWQIVSRP